MPQFPSAEDLGTRLPQDRGQVVQIARPDSSGQRAFAGALQNYAIQAKERQDRLSLQKAKTHWQKAKLEADNAFDQDTDFDTYLPRYQEMLDKGREDALKLIKNPDLKALFQEDVSLSMAQGIEGMKDYTFQREKDVGLATLDELLAENREIALNAKTEADRQSAFDTMNDSIATARLNGYISAEQDQSLRTKVGIDAAIGTIEVQDLRTQRDMLSNNEGPAELIPTDTRKKMLENVNNRLVNQEGMENADVIRQTGGTLTERMKAVNDIKDVDVRDATRRQVEHDYNVEEKARNDLYYNNYNEARKAINNPETSLNEWIKANPKQWDNMSGDQQLSLKSNGGKTETSRDAYSHITDLAIKDPNLALAFLRKNPSLFSSGDAQKWEDRLANPRELDKFVTRDEMLSLRFRDAGIDSSESKFKDSKVYLNAVKSIDRDVDSFQESVQRYPNQNELEAIIDRNFKIAEENWFRRDTLLFELDEEERAEFETKRVNRFYELLDQYMRDTGETPDDAKKQQLYQAWDNAGHLDAND